MDLEGLIGRASARLPVIRRVSRPVRALPGVWHATRSLTASKPRHTAEVRYAAVLDGRTMNLDIEAPYTGTEPPRTATLLFNGRRQRLSTPLRVRELAGGKLRLSATVRMGEGDVPVHNERHWRLTAVVTTASGSRVTYGLHGAPAPVWPEGPTVADPRCPRTGRQYRVGTDITGSTTLTVAPAKRTAEVIAVRPDWTTADVEIRAIGFTAGADPRLRLTARNNGAVVHVTGTTEGDRIHFDLPVASLAEKVTIEEWLWDVHLVTEKRELAVTSTLHDLTQPKAVLRPSTGVVSVAPGVAVRIRPYHTPGGRLVLACLRLASQPETTSRSTPE